MAHDRAIKDTPEVEGQRYLFMVNAEWVGQIVKEGRMLALTGCKSPTGTDAVELEYVSYRGGTTEESPFTDFEAAAAEIRERISAKKKVLILPQGISAVIIATRAAVQGQQELF